MISLSPCRRAERTKPSSLHSMSVFEVQAHGAIPFRIVLPILAEFDMQEQVDLAPGEGGDFGLGGLAHGLDPLPAFAQHDRPLALAGDDDLLADAKASIGEILPAF